MPPLPVFGPHRLARTSRSLQLRGSPLCAPCRWRPRWRQPVAWQKSLGHQPFRKWGRNMRTNDGKMMEKWWKSDGKLMDTSWTIENNRIYFTTVCSCVIFYLTSCTSSLSNREMFKQDKSRRSLLSFALALGCFGGISDSFCSFQLLGIRIFRAWLRSDWIRKTLAALNHCTAHTT